MKENSKRKYNYAYALIVLAAALFGGTSFANAKSTKGTTWVSSDEFIVEGEKNNDGTLNKKVYIHNTVLANEYVCDIEADGSCDDPKGRITSVSSFKHNKTYTNLSESELAEVIVYVFKKGDKIVWHWDNEKTVSKDKFVVSGVK